jgi:SAM-dependent methyltransferase
VNSRIVEQLIEINGKFYSDFAVAFSETRPSGQMRLDRIVPYIPEGGKVLDVGCGNGRLAERIEKEGRRVEYVGIDSSPQLIAIAESRAGRLQRVVTRFLVGDITSREWISTLAERSFDVALALAVVHHVPGFELRCSLLSLVRTRLKPGGVFVMTNWHFARNERLRKKTVPWDTVGIDVQDLEEGDALLSWRRGGTGYRYCHLITMPEVIRLAKRSGFRVEKQFYADADLNLYSVLIAT